MKVALVTIAIGEEYLKSYNEHFRLSHEVYASKNNYDFKVITDFLDPNLPILDTVTLSKLLLCCQSWSLEYDFIVYIDADILINPYSPPIHLLCEGKDGIGMVDEYSQPTRERRLEINKLENYEENATAYFKLTNIDFETESVFNGGLMVFQPKKHANFAETLYNKYANACIKNPRGFHYEQTVVNYEIQKNKLYEILPNQFNIILPLWHRDMINMGDFFITNYFIHFAGNAYYSLAPIIIRELYLLS